MPRKLPYINREVSWLAFNDRVLQEAANPSVPLLERVKFLGIFSSNLDEFFRVRVGTLLRLEKMEYDADADVVMGGSPEEILSQIHDLVMEQRRKFDRIFRLVLKELENEGIHIIDERRLSPEQENFVNDYFIHEVRPFLIPILVDKLKEFPYLENQVLYLAIRLSKAANQNDKMYAMIQVPVNVLPRFTVLPKEGERTFIIMLDDIIRSGLKQVFSIFDYDIIEAYTIKLTRDAEIDISDDVTKSFFEKISRGLKQRETGRPVRFVYDREMPEDLLNYILEKNNLKNFDNLIPGSRYHNARNFINFPKVGPRHLQYEAVSPIPQPFFDKKTSFFRALKERDVLLHYPYQSYDYMVDFLREAAIDPAVRSIKMTLYRVAKNSKIINALISAIQNGKQVTVLLELQARFDEEANIFWTTKLRDAGATVIDGVPGLKVHSKLCLITRREDNRNVRYATIGTGNFNEITARLYSDHTLYTSDLRLTNEVRRIFTFFKNNYNVPTTRNLIMAPFSMRQQWSRLIRNEINNAKAGRKAHIYLKMNALVDRDLINLLYKASQAGVIIRIMARSICSLVPGIPGISENIEAYSIVDKYLEHSRIFVFANNGQELFYISSADWMIRNLDNRVEVATPIYDPRLQEELRVFMKAQFRDNQKARILNETQDNPFRVDSSGKCYRLQSDFYRLLNDELIKQESTG